MRFHACYLHLLFCIFKKGLYGSIDWTAVSAILSRVIFKLCLLTLCSCSRQLHHLLYQNLSCATGVPHFSCDAVFFHLISTVLVLLRKLTRPLPILNKCTSEIQREAKKLSMHRTCLQSCARCQWCILLQNLGRVYKNVFIRTVHHSYCSFAYQHDSSHCLPFHPVLW